MVLKKTEIWPLDRNVFKDEDFAATETSSREEMQEIQIECLSQKLTTLLLQQEPEDLHILVDEPSTSTGVSIANRSNEIFGPHILSPLPQAKWKRRTAGVTAILTSSPYKNSLEIKN